MQVNRKYPCPLIEIDVADSSAPSGFRRLRGLVHDEFSLFDFMVEGGLIEKPDYDAGPEPGAEFYAAYAEIDIAEWALYGLIRGVNRNSTMGSSNERASWGDTLVKGRQSRHFVKTKYGFNACSFREQYLSSEFIIGRMTVRICWVSEESELVDYACRKISIFHRTTF